MKLTQLIFGVALAGLSFTAIAQWQWIDKDGRKVFSDRAPPIEIPDKDIIKRPAGRLAAPAPAADVADGASAEPGGSASTPLPTNKPSALDKALEEKKKQAKEAELAKRKMDEAIALKARVENCARLKQSQTTLSSNAPIGQINASGGREIMSEPARVQELQRVQAAIAQECR